MRILIAGGFGFLGGRLAVHLAKSSHEIVLGSSKSRCIPAWLPQARVAHLVWDDRLSLEQSCLGVDCVIQAAGMNAQECAADPVEALSFNGLATARLVSAACRARVKKFIYISTAHVYDSQLAGKITEENCPNNLHAYATSHLAGEQTVLSASHRGEIQGIVVRLSNAFGEPTHKEVNCWMLLVNDLCRQAVEKQKLVLRTSGIQYRDFVSLSWVCEVLENIALSNFVTVNSNIFNIGAGDSKPIIEMAQLIQLRCKQVLGFEPTLHQPADCGTEQPKVLNYRIDKLTKFGFKTNEINVTSEIDNLLRYCNNNFSLKLSL